MVTIEPRAMEPPILIGATISPTSAAFSVTMPSNGERMKDSSRWLSRTLTCAAAVRWRASAEGNGGPGNGSLRFGDDNPLFRLVLALLRPGDLRFRAGHFRAAVVHLGGGDGAARHEILVDFQTPPGVGQENLVLLVLGVERSQRRFCRGKLGFGLGGKFAQTLDFRRGFGHFRLGLHDRGVKLAVVDLRDHGALLDKIRLRHVQPGETSGELGGENRLPVGDDIAGGGELGAAVHRFAGRGRQLDGRRDGHLDDLQAPQQTRRQDHDGNDGQQDNPNPRRHSPPLPRAVDFQRRQAVRRYRRCFAHRGRHIRPNLKVTAQLTFLS